MKLRLPLEHPKDRLEFFWVIFDTSVRKEYYLDVHNLLAQPVGSIIRYNYRRSQCTEAAWAKVTTRALGHDVLLAYTQYKGFKRGDDYTDKAKFPDGTEKWHCPTRYARMAGIKMIGDTVYLDLLLLDYPQPGSAAFGKLMTDLTARNAVPFDKFIEIHTEWGVFNTREDPDPSGTTENWSAIASELEQNAQFSGDSFWRLAGPFRRGSNEMIPHVRLQLRDGSIFQLRFRDSEIAYFQVHNQESRSKAAKSSAENRSVKVAVSDPSLQVRETVISLRQYFETSLFFRATKQESLRPAEPVIEFSTVDAVNQSDYHFGPAFKLPISVGPDMRKLIVGGIAAFFGAIMATIALKEDPTFRDLGVLAGALALLAIASVLLHDKLKIASGGDD